MQRSVAKPVDVLDKKAALEKSVGVLKAHDPEIQEVLATAAHVTLYDLDTTRMAYNRKGIEGSFFLVKRGVAPRFRFLILEKKSRNIFLQDITEGFALEVQEKDEGTFLLYRNEKNEIIACWFYEKTECKPVADIIKRILQLPGFSARKPEEESEIENKFFKNKARSEPDANAPADKAPREPGKLPAPAEDSIARFFANLGPKGIVQAGPSAQAASPARPPQVSPPAPMTNGKPETNLSPKAPSVGSLPMPSGSRATGPGSEREDSQGAEQDSAPTSVLFTQRNQTPLRTPRLAPDPKVVRPSDFLALPLLPTSRSSVRGDAEAGLTNPGIERDAGRDARSTNINDVDRQKLRTAFASLVQSDEFIDLVALHLQKAGVLK